MKSVGKLERTVSQVPSVLAFNQTAPDANNISESLRILFRYTIVIQCIVVLCVNPKKQTIHLVFRNYKLIKVAFCIVAIIDLLFPLLHDNHFAQFRSRRRRENVS